VPPKISATRQCDRTDGLPVIIAYSLRQIADSLTPYGSRSLLGAEKRGQSTGYNCGYVDSQVRGLTAPSGGSSVVFNIYGMCYLAPFRA